MTPDDLAHYERLVDDKHDRDRELLELVGEDYRARRHGPYRIADRTVGMPTRTREDR